MFDRKFNLVDTFGMFKLKILSTELRLKDNQEKIHSSLQSESNTNIFC